jgi:polar amino acid transport system permease protein
VSETVKKNPSLLDIALILFILAAGAWLLYRIKVGLHYHWDWYAIPQYFLRYDPEKGKWVSNLLLQGLFTTIRLSIWGTLLAALLGVIMGLCRMSRSLFLRLLSRTYIEFNRNLPPIVLIFLFYYFISSQTLESLDFQGLVQTLPANFQTLVGLLFGPPRLLVPFVSALVTLGFFEGAYIAEIVRSGVQSIEKEQWEAGRAIGLSRWRLMRLVIFPLTIRKILPPLAGQFVSTIKDSAIVSVISVQELTFQGMELMSSTYLVFEIWITVTALYMALTLPVSLSIQRLEVYLRRNIS